MSQRDPTKNVLQEADKITPERGTWHISFGSKKSNTGSFGGEPTNEKRWESREPMAIQEDIDGEA